MSVITEMQNIPGVNYPTMHSFPLEKHVYVEISDIVNDRIVRMISLLFRSI